MKAGEKESWVTVVLDDRMGWEALVLAASIKRHLTLRKLTVLIETQKVSGKMQEMLRGAFDYVETLQNASVVYGGKELLNDKFWKRYLWSLLLWKKCVFIASDSLVLESIEDLFDLEEFSAPAVRFGPQKRMSLDLFVFQPNRGTLKALSDDAIVKHFWKTWAATATKRIKDGMVLPLLSQQSHLHCQQPRVVQFGQKPWTHKTYTGKWCQILEEDVLPQLQSCELLEFLETSSKELGIPLLKALPSTVPVNMAENWSDCIAVVGMSCRFPGANSVEEYWNLLVDGRSAIRPFPDGRRTFEAVGIRKDVAGFLSCAVDEFDAKFFGISPREAPLLDPQQRHLLEVIWESLEDAGIDGSLLKETPTGVFVGVLTQDYDRMLPRNGYIGNEYHHRFLGNAISAIAGRISFFLGLTGPNMAVESGCSSSLAALHLGCQSLRSGESNLVISGGVNLIIIPRNSSVAGTDAGETLKKDADGFISGEGVATIVLKRYADAVRDGDKIRAIVRGSAIGNDGGNISGGTASADEQVRVYREALENSHVQPSEISYVEAHGPEETEVTALNEVYSKTNRAEPLLIGSVKPNIGYCESAGGIASIIKLILAFERETIPKNLNFQNSNLPLQEFKIKIPATNVPWRGEKRIVATNSLSSTGTLVHFILQSADKIPAETLSADKIPAKTESTGKIPAETLPPTPQPQLVLISAKTPEALEAQLKNYENFFEKNRDWPLDEIAFATNLCRTHFSHRVAVFAENTADLIQKLKSKDFTSTGKVSNSNSKLPPIGFLFTGQFTQYLGMAKGLYSLFTPFRETLDYCSEVYQRLSGFSLLKIMFEDETKLRETEFSQPAIFCVQISLVKLWAHFGIQPSVVLGSSLGEYAAAVAADVMSIEDGLRLVVGRSQLANQMKPGRMLAVKGSLTLVEKMLAEVNLTETLDIAAVNSPTQIILAGPPEAVEAFEKCCAEREIKTHRLASAQAFHSKDIEDILDEFGEIAQSIQYNSPTCTYISSTLARRLIPEDFRAEYWQCHLRDPIQFSKAVSLLANSTQILIEIGPQPVLLGLAMANYGLHSNQNQTQNEAKSQNQLVCCPSMRRVEENSYTFYTALAKLHVSGIPIDWKSHFAGKSKNLKLPLYPFQRQKFWFVLSDYTDEEDDKEREGIFINAERIHPILGYKIRTPGRIHFAQSKLLKELPYFNHCTIANAPFLTAGGVVELFLAAANQKRLTCDLRPATCSAGQLQLKSIHFCDYLRLDKDTTIHTLIDDSLVTLYEQTNGSWNVIAKMEIPPENKEKNTIGFEKSRDWLKREMEDSDWLNKSVELEVTDFYESEPEVYFGNHYRRIKKLRKFEDGTILGELCTFVQDPAILGQRSSTYIAFPTVLDSMLHCALVAQNCTGAVCLPKKIDAITWFGKTVNSSELVVRADKTGVSLSSRSGDILATIEGVEFPEKSDEQIRENRNLTSTAIPQHNALTSAEMQDQRSLTFDLGDSHINMEDLKDERLRILAEIIARPSSKLSAPDRSYDIVEKPLEVSQKSDGGQEMWLESLEERLEKLVRQTLRLAEGEMLDMDQNLAEVGVDSLMGLEIGTKIQDWIQHKQIPPTIVQEFPTIRTLLAALRQ